ncbi:uncharacterized protein BP5553_10437 [Venustampulla echinocandica]|uniref:Uncharacterized protein n=1 Tax=Venustampulla echinocandica TaxID=2656787 RepID=A0A370T9C7_9HELO|nr:uncharacterized protein BP5553_10437 [Venustampulla echinocandica]RDL30159.1 hypothetical protein BP5553_10437 [Venustampulla echinocandica]
MLSNALVPFAVLLALSSAAPSPVDVPVHTIPQSRDDYHIYPTVKLDGSPLDKALINANNGELYIGKPTTAECQEAYPCDTLSNATAIIVSNNGAGAAMDVYVPGGQILYVRKTGELGYTAAHAQNVPSDATQKGFMRVEFFPSDKSAYAAVIFHGEAFLACPLGEEGVYRVHAFADSRTDCTKIEIQAVDSGSEPHAYQYTAPYTVS